MLKITIPNNNISERKYIVDIIFDEFLGLDYELIVNKYCNNWEIELSNNSKLIIEDHFFNKFQNDLEYLNLSNIPKIVKYETKDRNKFLSEDNIPIVFGIEKLELKNKKQNVIICGIDIFSSCFFMLTRWEENVKKKLDKFSRFPASESLAYKSDFLNRAIVNEYLEMLWNMLKFLDFEKNRKSREFNVMLTHDIDFLLLSKTPLKIIIKTLLGDILKRKNFKLALSYMCDYIRSLSSKNKDPYNTFSYLMDLSEKINLKSYFFFMGKGTSIYDNNYILNDKYLKEIIIKIQEREHYIGIHPTFNSYNNNEQFKSEKLELESAFDKSLTFGREHYLRFEVPTTWQIWEDNAMQWDSTLYYPEKEGFRCGTCYEFSVFNILSRKKLNLKEKPLIFMDGFTSYQNNPDANDVLENVTNLINIVKKYEGTFIMLWHNCSFNNREWKNYKFLYENILDKIKEGKK